MSEPTTATTDRDPVVGKLDADRLCARCLQQLAGTTVYREPRLGILYLRCTECGTAAPVTEYPASWRWMRRFGVIVAALVLLLCFVLLVADVFANSSCTYMAGWESIRDFADQLTQAGVKIDSQATWRAPPQFIADTASIEAIGTDPTLWRAAWRAVLFNAIPGVIASILSGIVWSLLLLHRRLAVALLWQIVPMVLACLVVAIIFLVQMPSAQNTMTYADLAYWHFGLPFTLFSIATSAAARIVAVIATRPLARLSLRVLIPVKLRGAIASVWANDAVPS